MATLIMSGMWPSMEVLVVNLMAREVEYCIHILTLNMVETLIKCPTIMK